MVFSFLVLYGFWDLKQTIYQGFGSGIYDKKGN